MKLADHNKRLGLFIVVLILLCPLGLIVPNLFNAGSAWGEWSGEELKHILGYVPAGFQKFSSIWHPLLPDYNLSFNNSGNIVFDSISYIAAGIIGAGLCFITSYILLKGIFREN